MSELAELEGIPDASKELWVKLVAEDLRPVHELFKDVKSYQQSISQRSTVEDAEVARVMTSRRRVNEPGVGMGLEFLDLTGDEKEALDRWLRPRRAPVPRRRRPTPRFRVSPPVMTRSFDEIRGTTAVQPVHASAVATPSEAPCAVPPLDFRPLKSAWR